MLVYFAEMKHEAEYGNSNLHGPLKHLYNHSMKYYLPPGVINVRWHMFYMSSMNLVHLLYIMFPHCSDNPRQYCAVLSCLMIHNDVLWSDVTGCVTMCSDVV